MRIAIAGVGRIGATLGRIWAGRGHEVDHHARRRFGPKRLLHTTGYARG